MLVKVKVFAITTKRNAVKSGRVPYEQKAQLVQEDDGMPDCPFVITHWAAKEGDTVDTLPAGLYTADLHMEAAPYGQMVPHVSNLKLAGSGQGAQRPGAAPKAVAA